MDWDLIVRVGLVLLAGLGLWIGLHSALTVWIGVNSKPRPSDVAVVLGTSVSRSGVPSSRLRERLDRALQLYREGTVKNIIVSGGFGREGHEEADVMAEYLQQHDVPETRIFRDRNGYDTFESARNTKVIMDGNDLHSAVIVSHYYHLPRALVTFKRFDVPNVSAAAVNIPPTWRDTWSVLREFAAFYYYLVRDYAPT